MILPRIVALRLNALEEHARRAVQLRHDHALGAVDDERSVVRHQRDFAEEDFLLLDVPDALLPRLRVLGIHRQPDGDFQRRRVRHAALLALQHVVFQLQAHRVAALVAERDHVLVERAAMVAEDVARVERVGADGGAAIPAGGAQVVQPLQVAALALPVADGIVHEFQVADAAEVRNREHRVEHRLQTDVLALVGQKIHLQKTLVGRLLNLNQVRNRNGGLDLGEIHSFGGGAVMLIIHS